MTELQGIAKNIEHIKAIVAMQQNYAVGQGLKEQVCVRDLVDDAVRMNEGALIRHEVALIREFAELPLLLTDKHKVLQILVNVIRNAKHACDVMDHHHRQIRIRTYKYDHGIRIAVTDNGIGIAPENLTRIFSHGFTTRKDGHGFGLHSAALAAKELGGSLSVQSDGAGCGATFELELPTGDSKPAKPDTIGEHHE